MSILLAGGTGFIGQAIATHFLEQNPTESIVILTRRPRQNQDRCIYVPWNAKQLPDLPQTKFSAIINLCGAPIIKRWTKAYKKELYNSRIHSTLAIVEAINTGQITSDVVVNASAVGIYPSDPSQAHSETSPQGQSFLAGLCQDWEAAANKVDPTKTRLVIPRIGIVLGKEGGMLKQVLPVYKAGLGGPIGSGKQWMSWIHLQDLIGLIFQAITQPTWKGPFNAVSSQPVTMSEFSKTLAKTLRRPNLFKVPEWAVKLGFGQASSVMLDSVKATPDFALKNEYKFQYPNLNQALQQLLKSE